MTDYVQLPSGMVVPASFAEAAAAAPESREIATTQDGRDITRGFVSPMQQLAPQDPVLMARGAGNYHIYREVLRDTQAASTFAQRRLAVIARPWEVEPGGKRAIDKAAAEFLKKQLQRVRWDAVTNGMLYGVFYGYAVAEMLWGREGRYVTINGIRVRDRRRFAFDGAMRLRLMTSSQPNPGEILPERKFWSFCTGADHDDDPYGIGLAHWLYWPVFFKRAGIRFWMIFLEKFGQPTAKGSYPGSATPEEKTRLLNALAAINTDAGVILPEGMAIELIEAARSGTADYVKLHDSMDAAIAKVVLGQTLTTEAAGGQYKADVQMDVRQDLVKSDADLVCESFNAGPARWLTEWNFPGAECPRVFRQIDEGEDLAKRAEVDKNLHEMGYEYESIDQVNETYGGRWKKKAAASLPDPSAPRSQSPEGAAFAESARDAVSAAVAEQAALDKAAGELSARWQEMIGPRIDELIAFAEQTGDLVTFRERLSELLMAPPRKELVESLERAGFIARLSGMTADGDRG
jgi:phage gp29-like protein